MKSTARRLSLALLAMPMTLIALATPAHAAGILDSTTSAFQSLEGTWFSALIGDAKDLFTILAGLEVTWLALNWMLARRTFDEIVPSLVKKIITLGFFAAVLINAQTWVPDVINSFAQAGSTASGLPALSPSTIAGYAIQYPLEILAGQSAQSGTSMFGAAIQAVKDTIDPAMWLEMIERILIAIMMFFAFIYIAIEMMVLLIESYIVIGAGVLFLGFGGSRWTNKFVDGYINFAVSVGVKLFVIYLIVGALISTVIPQINEQIMTTGAFNFSGGLTAGAIMIVAAMLAKKIPDHAGALLGAGAGMTAGAFGAEAGRAAMAVAAVGAGVATAGAGTAAAAGAAGVGGAAAGGAGAAAGSVGAATSGAAAGAGAGSSAGGVAASSGAGGVAAPQAAAASGPGAGGGVGPGAASTGAKPPAPPSAGSIMRNMASAAKHLHIGGSDKAVSANHISTSHGNE